MTKMTIFLTKRSKYQFLDPKLKKSEHRIVGRYVVENLTKFQPKSQKTQWRCILGNQESYILGSENGVFCAGLAHFLEKYLRFLNETKTIKC